MESAFVNEEYPKLHSVPAAPGEDAGDRQLAEPPVPPASPDESYTSASPQSSDFIAELIRVSGLLAPEKLDAVQERARGGSFSRALLDEGFANSLGVARNLAEQYHLPLIDLAIEGVSSEASKM